ISTIHHFYFYLSFGFTLLFPLFDWVHDHITAGDVLEYYDRCKLHDGSFNIPNCLEGILTYFGVQSLLLSGTKSATCCQEKKNKTTPQSKEYIFPGCFHLSVNKPIKHILFLTRAHLLTMFANFTWWRMGMGKSDHSMCKMQFKKRSENFGGSKYEANSGSEGPKGLRHSCRTSGKL
ncbi:hypothetical protein IFM89_033161, partial [Coptis chinensis]